MRSTFVGDLRSDSLSGSSMGIEGAAKQDEGEVQGRDIVELDTRSITALRAIGVLFGGESTQAQL